MPATHEVLNQPPPLADYNVFEAEAVHAEGQARRLSDRLALLVQASLLVRFSAPAVADAFCATRLDRDGGFVFGSLPPSADVTGILDRAWHQTKV